MAAFGIYNSTVDVAVPHFIYVIFESLYLSGDGVLGN